MAFSDCIQFIYLGISIASLVYICKIFTLTKNDLFDIKLEDPGTYFISTVQTFSKMDKQCKCGEEVVNDFCTEEQILSGCVDISLNQNLDKQKFLRFLLDGEQCRSYEYSIKDGKKLNEVFKLNVSGIHEMAMGLIGVVVISFAVLVLILFLSCGAACGTLCCGENAAFILLPCVPVIMIIGFGSGITCLVLFIILCVRYYGGDTNKYVEFLDCYNVNKNKFSEKFKDIEELKSDFTVFMVLCIIYLVLNFCSSGSSSQKKNEEY